MSSLSPHRPGGGGVYARCGYTGGTAYFSPAPADLAQQPHMWTSSAGMYLLILLLTRDSRLSRLSVKPIRSNHEAWNLISAVIRIVEFSCDSVGNLFF